MLDPGWVAGMRISPMPQRGPLASQRMSLAILVMATAMARSWPAASQTASLAAWASKWFWASGEGDPGDLGQLASHAGPELRVRVDAGTDGGCRRWATRQRGPSPARPARR